MRARLSARAAIPVEPAYAAARPSYAIGAPGLDASSFAEAVPASATNQRFACDDGAALQLDRAQDGAALQATWSDTGDRALLRRTSDAATWENNSVQLRTAGARAVWISRSGGAVTVAHGDTLSRIAQRIYGDAAQAAAIGAANADQISDPDRIYAGQVLRLPGRQVERRCRRVG
ncbi:MAG: LysM peptidoglycan-binding domain-containing protein [Alphaproteobacteria bacterium]|nr:LysM peptidoglycan-binding domain-containing protein [Alphaproteobacteria bacterium]